ncbi:hypothetical protein E4U41_007107 [Claviceps citrina]|nr:hypothetical protein E4U41_007107 [Claviceps citrina]
MREIVTLQLGHLSNYAATHFWNAQESYFTYGDDRGAEPAVDHDVHWRAGVGADGAETFLPRTVIYDLKGGFGSLRKTSALYDAGAGASLWSGEPALHKQRPLAPSAYQESLDAGTEPAPLTTSQVRYWSDFSRTYFHPRSAVQLYDYELDSSIRPFESFGMGAELFSSLDREQDLVDRDWRPFVEECDLMQGMQVFTSLDDAWAGFGSCYLEQLRDEYPKSCIWVWGAQSPSHAVPGEKRRLRTANLAQSLCQGFFSQASVLVPLAVPESSGSASASAPPIAPLDRSSPWHTSALFAAVAETALLPSRLRGRRSDRASMADVAESLNVSGNQTLVAAGMSPYPPGRSAEADDEKEAVSLFHIGTTGRGSGGGTRRSKDRRDRVFGQVTCCRGPDDENPTQNSPSENADRNISGAPVIKRIEITRYTTPLEFPLLDSYPRIYTPPTPPPAAAAAASRTSMPLRAFLRTDTSIRARLRALRAQTSRRLIGLDEREALSNGIAEMADAYRDDWSSGSDDDDDDL